MIPVPQDARNAINGFWTTARNNASAPLVRRLNRDWITPTDVIKAILRLAKFYKHESCRPVYAVPAKGTGWRCAVMDRLVRAMQNQKKSTVARCDQTGREANTICALGERRFGLFQVLIRTSVTRSGSHQHKRTGRVSAVAAE